MRKIIKEVTVTYEDGATETFYPEKDRQIYFQGFNNNYIVNGKVTSPFIDYSINWIKLKEE